MTKDRFLTVRWNNWLTLALGLPALIYVIASFTTLAWSTKNGLISLSIFGVIY